MLEKVEILLQKLTEIIAILKDNNSIFCESKTIIHYYVRIFNNGNAFYAKKVDTYFNK